MLTKGKMQNPHSHAGVTTISVTDCPRLSLTLDSREIVYFDFPAISGFLSVAVREATSVGASQLLACGQQVFESTLCLGDANIDVAHVDVFCAKNKCRIDLEKAAPVRFANLRLYRLAPGVHPTSYTGLPIYTADIILSQNRLTPPVSTGGDTASVMATHISWPGLTVLTSQAESILSPRLQEGIELETNMEELGRLFDQGVLFPVWGLPETTCRVVVLPPDWKGQWSAFGCRVLQPVRYRLSHPSDTLTLHTGPRLSPAPDVSWRCSTHQLIHSLSMSAYVTGMLVCTVLIQLHGLMTQQASTSAEAITQLEPMNRYADTCPGWRSGVDPLVFV